MSRFTRRAFELQNQRRVGGAVNYQPAKESFRESAGIRGAIVLAFAAIIFGLVALLYIVGGG